MDEEREVQVDVSNMDKDLMLKMYEIQWQDHFQTRSQTWQALQITALLTIAIIGIQWKASNPVIGIFSSSLLMGISLFGMQITFRHRNSVEKTKFTVIIEIEKHLGFRAARLKAPRRIGMQKFQGQTTYLFLVFRYLGKTGGRLPVY